MSQQNIIQPYMVLEIEDKIDTIDYFNYFLSIQYKKNNKDFSKL